MSPTWARWAAVVAGLWATTTLKSQSVETVQGGLRSHIVVEESKGDSSLKTVCGLVVDERQQPILGATIGIFGSNISTKTDALGFFSLEMAEIQFPQNTMLVVTADGLAKQTKSIEAFKNGVSHQVFTMRKRRFVIKGSVMDTSSKELLVGAALVLYYTESGFRIHFNSSALVQQKKRGGF